VGNDKRPYYTSSRALRSGAPALLFLVLNIHLLLAQEKLLPVYHFNRVPTPVEHIRSRVARDSSGFVWIGTANGLERYDGYSINEYRHVMDDPHSLSSNAIWSLLVDRKNRLWVGTFETGLSLYDAARDRFVNFLPRPGDSLSLQSRGVLALMEDRAGSIWMGLEFGGVARLEIRDDGEFADLDSLASRVRFRTYPLATPRDIARDFFEREDGKLLVASDSGLIILDPGSGELSRLHLADPLGRQLDTLSVHCIARDRYGNLWVGSGKHGHSGSTRGVAAW
jgi:ligand-binding sensor domain-containing protein